MVLPALTRSQIFWLLTMLTVVDNASMTVRALLPLELWNESLLEKPAQVIFQQQTYQGRVTGASKQVTIGDNNYPAVTLRIEFAAEGKLGAGLPVKVNISDN